MTIITTHTHPSPHQQSIHPSHTPPPETQQRQARSAAQPASQPATMSTGGGTGGGAPGSISPADELFSIAQSRTEPGPRREAELARARQLLGAHKVGGRGVGSGLGKRWWGWGSVGSIASSFGLGDSVMCLVSRPTPSTPPPTPGARPRARAGGRGDAATPGVCRGTL